MARKGKKQLEIAGAERQTDAELDECVERLASIRYERMRLQGEEGEAAEELVERLQEKGLTQYVYEDGDVKITAKLKQSSNSKIALKREELIQDLIETEAAA
jgi:hypothetical protein